jgi:hypothetical protein
MNLEMTKADREALEKEYAQGEISRDAIERYPLVRRGSIRLVRGLYRTESEYRAYLEKGLQMSLPGQKVHYNPLSHFKSLLRAIFSSRWKRWSDE